MYMSSGPDIVKAELFYEVVQEILTFEARNFLPYGQMWAKADTGAKGLFYTELCIMWAEGTPSAHIMQSSVQCLCIC